MAKEIHCLPTLLSRQPQRTESRAGFDNAGPGEGSHLPEEVALQRDLAVFPRKQIRRQRMEPVSLILDSRCTQSIFALLFILGELRPLHSC